MAKAPINHAGESAFQYLYLLVFLAICSSASAEDESGWNITAECQMVVLPQKIALPFLADLNDEEKTERAFAKIQALMAKGEGELAANMVIKSRNGQKVTSESVEEVRHGTAFEGPILPRNAAENIEVMKVWPAVAITPGGWQTQSVGTTLELTATMLKDGKAMEVNLAAQHVRLLRIAKFDAGGIADGKRLSIEEPVFHTLKNSSTLTLRNGQRILLGVHRLAEPCDNLEFFFFKVSASRAP